MTANLRASLWSMIAGLVLLICATETIRAGVEPALPLVLGVAGFCALALAAILLTNDGDI